LNYEAWGSDKTYPHMAVAWAWAFDTPFKWTKQVASHFGGTRQGLAISWPGHIKDVGGIRTQFHHVIDIVPMILEATGIQTPVTVNAYAKAHRRREHGLHVRPGQCQGTSKRDTQYFEMAGNRGIYHGRLGMPPRRLSLRPGLGNGKLPDVVTATSGAL